RHIDHCAHVFHDISSRIADRMSERMEVLHGAVGQHDPVIVYVFCFFTECLLDTSVRPVAIFWVDSLPDIFAGRYTLLRIPSKNTVHFLGPIVSHFVGAVPSPTARVTQSLRLRKITLTAPQGLFGPLALGDVL